jgi:hypothetical protein
VWCAGFEDAHVGHGHGEVLVRVVYGYVLGCALVWEHPYARGLHAGCFEGLEGRAPAEVVADGAAEAHGRSHEMGGFGNVVGYTAESLADYCWVGSVQCWVCLVWGTGEGRIVTGEINGKGAGYEDVDRGLYGVLGCAGGGL